jgi:hypothetical protein
VLKWAWLGMALLVVEHAYSVLFMQSASEFHVEFIRLFRAKFNITGSEEPDSKFCGCQVGFDARAKTIAMYHEDFARAVLTKYGAKNQKPEATPFVVVDPPLEPLRARLRTCRRSSSPCSSATSRG